MEYLGLVCEEQPSAATLMIVWDESVVTQMAKMRGRRWNLKANDQKETNIFGFKVSSLFSLPFGCQELYIFLNFRITLLPCDFEDPRNIPGYFLSSFPIPEWKFMMLLRQCC